tara:strand:+ start:176 stop:610 length:435 start_codon:yes stop_codon:yes gene_type:complete
MSKITDKAKTLNAESNRVADAKAKGITLTEQRQQELLAKVSTGGSTSRGGTWTLGADIDSLADITTQVSKYAGIVVALGGNATPNEVDKFSETSTGNLFWGYDNGTQYEQKPSKIMFGTYFDKATGKVEWSKSKGKKEILVYKS